MTARFPRAPELKGALGTSRPTRTPRLPPGGGHVVAACRSGLLRRTASLAGASHGWAAGLADLAGWHDRLGPLRPLRWRGRWVLAAPLWERSLRDRARAGLGEVARFVGAGPPPDGAAAWRRRRSRRRTPGSDLVRPLPVEAAPGSPAPGAAQPTSPWFAVPPARPATGEPRFPIDVVYTWVDGHDPQWRARYAEALLTSDDDELHGHAVNPCRFRNRDELRYSLRSLARFAPFVRRVFVVTDGQVPAWLEQAAPNVRVVPHTEILEAECLPTFNSHAIETALHRIDGLAEHYLYLNDDFFFGAPCRASTFFTGDGRAKLFPDTRAIVPVGAPTASDRPVDSASKHTRDLMRDEFGLVIEHKMQHVPYPQRRSVLAEMEERFPQAFKQTARNRFRHHTDVNIASCLSHYYGFATGAAVPGAVPAAYVNIGSPWAPLQLRRLLGRGDRAVFCLNEGSVSVKRQALVDASVRAFLRSYFPEPSPFERGSVRQAPEAGHVGEAVQRG